MGKRPTAGSKKTAKKVTSVRRSKPKPARRKKVTRKPMSLDLVYFDAFNSCWG